MRRVSIPLAIAALLIATDLFAQSNPHDHDEAVKLFLEGKIHRDEGHCELAIPKLEASLLKEESIGAHYNLGVCYERSDKRKALQNYNDALRIAKDKKDDREREIRAQLSDFLDHTAHIRLVLPPPMPSGLKIAVDGDQIPLQQLQQETIWFAPDKAKDKTDFQVLATAPGYENKAMTVKRGALATVVLNKIPTAAPRGEDEGGFQWWHGVGIGSIVVGAVGVAYALAKYFSYDNTRAQLEDKYNQLSNDAADEAAKKTNTTPDKVDRKTMCTVTNPRIVSQGICDDRAQALADYNSNEKDGTEHLPLWVGIGIGGVLFIAAGTVLLVGGSSFFGKSSSSDPKAAKNTRTIRFLPTLGPHEHGAVLVGTF